MIGCERRRLATATNYPHYRRNVYKDLRTKAGK